MENVTSLRILSNWKFHISIAIFVFTSLTGIGQSVPVAVEDAATTPEDTAVTVNVQQNDSDADGDPMTTSIVTGPSHGSAMVVNNDSITYTPNPDYFGPDSLQYAVCDGTDGCDTAWVMIQVLSVNDNPVAVDDFGSTAQNTPVVLHVLTNDSDADADSMSVTSVLVPSNHGTTTILAGTSVQYVPNTGYNGLDSFQYQVCDTNGGCANAWAFVVVSGTNDAPTAFDDFVTLPEDSNIVIDVQANDVDPEGNSLYTFVLNQPPNGLVTVEDFDSITYDPLPDYYGPDFFDYAVCDGGGLCDTATVYLTVTPVNDSVIANNDLMTTPESTTGMFDVQLNDADADFDTLITMAILTNPNYGSAVIVNGDSVAYTPVPGYVGPDTFEYMVCDQYMLCDSAIVVIDVTNLNDAPIAMDDSATTWEDTPVTIDVQANDYDPDGGFLVTSIVIPPANGSVVVLNNDSVLYTPSLNFVGLDSFQYQVCDNTSLCDQAWVYVTVLPVNDPPIAVDDFVFTPENTPIDIDVQANDSDPDGDPLTTAITSGPSNGTASVLSGDSIEYIPNFGFVGYDTLYYQVCDPSSLCDTAMVVIRVDNLNFTPIANDDFVTTYEEVPVMIDVQANDIDPIGALLVTSIVANPANGSVSVVNLDSVLYTPDIDFVGMDTFYYSVCNPTVLCDSAMVVVQVLPVNDAPVANNDTITVLEDSTEIIDVQSNDTDPEGDPLTTVVLNTYNGSAIVINGDSIQYTPDLNYNGPDSLQYEVCDNNGDCDEAWVYITVIPVNDTPVANDDNVTTPEDTPVLVNVQANDVDVDGDDLATALVALPANGSATVIGDDINYVPNLNFTGNDTLQYSVCDPSGLCDTAFVYIQVTPINDCPIAVNDTVIIDENETDVIYVQFNDIDPEGNSLLTSIVTSPNNGTVSLMNGDSIQYTPNQYFFGTDTFSYRVCEGSGCCDTALVVVNIQPIDNAPVAVNDFVTTPEDTPVTVDVQANDLEPDGSAMVTTIVSGPANGAAIVEMQDSITYTPNLDYNGFDTIYYSVCDPVLCDTAMLVINVLPVNDAPIALDDSATTNEDVPVSVPVLANDSDVDGGALVLSSILTGAVNGSATISGSDIDYVPNANYTGWDSLQYEVCDGNGGCASAWVYILVMPINDVPVAMDDTVTTQEDTPIMVNVLANDVDADGDPLTTTAILAAPANGTAVISGNDIEYTPSPDFYGADMFQYQACDNNGACDAAWVYVTVTPVNDVPIAGDDSATTQEGTPVSVNVIANDTDVDGDPLNISGITIAALNGTATVVGNQVLYDPNPGFIGWDSLQYEVCDGVGGCANAWVYIQVLEMDTTPIALDDHVTTPEDTPVSVAVLANDSDPNGDPLSLNAILTASVNGSANINGNNADYSPNLNFTGLDSLQYEVCDNNGNCANAWVYITVVPVNDAPVAMDDTATTDMDIPVLVDVVANDIDFDGDPLALTAITVQPNNGTVTIESTTEVEYTPAPGYVGTDVFLYEVCDNNGTCDQATVTITIETEGLKPVAVDDYDEVNLGNTAVVQVLQNDYDLNGEDLTLTQIVDQPAKGTATIVAGGNIEYHASPQAGIGADIFSYEVCNESGLCDSARVFMTLKEGVDVGIIIPEGISPNGDGNNDQFVIQGLEQFPNNKIVIFNRWGSQVYEQAQYNNDWSGQNMDGSVLPDGTYFYLLDIEGSDVTYTGFIDLRRN